MSTVASIVLYAMAVFAGTMIGVGAGRTKNKAPDEETQNSLIVAGVALILFFGLAVALQVAA